jgi:hypothetical protein
VATRVWEITDHLLVPYLGNYSYAMRQKARRVAAVPKVRATPPAAPPGGHQTAPPRSNGVESATRLERKLLSAEREIGKLEGRLNEVSDAIAIAGIDGDREGLERLSVEYATIQEHLDGAYALWDDLNGRLATVAAGAGAG